MSTPSSAELDLVFGPGSVGATPEERSRTAQQTYVRSLDQIARNNPRATGRRLSAREALDAYGYAVLREVAEQGSALLCEGRDAASRAIKMQRKSLGLDIRTVANRARLSIQQIEEAEEGGRHPLSHYERIAQVLGIDERYVSVRSSPVGNQGITIRLRTLLGKEQPLMTRSAVTAIAEAAWIATTQVRLEKALGFSNRLGEFVRSSNYGSHGYPAYLHGYYLASSAREQLELGLGPLECSLREICEDYLGVPVIQTDLGERIAGLTVEAGDARAIVLNTAGHNSNVFIRRSTLAHELGHLLYDPPDKLEHLRVDEYVELGRDALDLIDPVEQRANAFAVEFIAPQVAVLDVFKSNGGSQGGGLRAVVDMFGISSTAARYQIWNGMGRRIPLGEIKLVGNGEIAEWEGKEGYAAAYHPIKDLPTSRAGRFSATVIRSAQKEILSWDTATSYLRTNQMDLDAAIESIQEMYPKVFDK